MIGTHALYQGDGLTEDHPVAGEYALHIFRHGTVTTPHLFFQIRVHTGRPGHAFIDDQSLVMRVVFGMFHCLLIKLKPNEVFYKDTSFGV